MPPQPARLSDAIRDAAARLSRSSETARLDAELLAAHGLGLERMDMLARMSDLSAPDGFAEMLARRMAQEPVAYITGKQAFWDIELSVTPDVLIPRADSETLIEAAQQHFAGRTPPASILDLGTGSGALLLAALSLFPDARGIGIDASEAALAVTRGNAAALGMAERCDMRRLSWHETEWAEHLKNTASAEPVEIRLSGEAPFDRLRATVGPSGPFDLILCNPPYIEDNAQLDPMVAEYEPHAALFAGEDGMADYRATIPAIPMLLAQDGIALFEIGYTQAEAVAALAADSGMIAMVRDDLAGKPRCVVMQHRQKPQKQRKSRGLPR